MDSTAPSRATTINTVASEDAVPDLDPTSAAGLLSERLLAWSSAVKYLEEYITAVEKIHKSQAKEYEKALKTISHPLKHGEHFDQNLGGIAGYFENMRANTQGLVTTNHETERSIKGSIIPTLDRLAKEIKSKTKEVTHGASKNAKEVEKARNGTQKQIELLGQQTATFDSSGGKMHGNDDPYCVARGVQYHLGQQVLHENNHHNDLVAVQNSFQEFEAHIITTMQQVMANFTQLAGGQGEKTRALHADMLSSIQGVPVDFEWKGFTHRNADKLINPNDPPRSVDQIAYPNQQHASVKPLIEGTLERKSRNKLSWGYQTGYYVVTAAKFLHEFKDSDDSRHEPKPELSIFLPDALIGQPNGDKFHVKGKDVSKHFGGKLSGSSELAFKAHTMVDAERWFEVIRSIAGATGPASLNSPTEPNSPVAGDMMSPTEHRTDGVAMHDGAVPASAGGINDKPATANNPIVPVQRQQAEAPPTLSQPTVPHQQQQPAAAAAAPQAV